jgi:enoyl-CoA hydratase/carnithine racemase
MILNSRDLIENARQYIDYRKDPRTKIAYLSFRNPEELNAVSTGMRLLYADIVHSANIDDEVKVLVIRSEGEHFGTGADLAAQFKGYEEGPGGSPLHEFRIDDDPPDVKYPPRESYRYIHGVCDLYSKPISGCRSLQQFKKISILEAKGYCYGWHFYEAADADLVVSSEEALFGHPAFRYVGWGPRLWWWAETMGLRKFAEMLFTGRPFTAREMHECGFVNSVVPRDKLEEETAKYASACARSRPTDTVAVQKTFLEIYKQYRGEQMGSTLTAAIEAMWPLMHHEPGDLELNEETFAAGINKAVKDMEKGYPPEWRMSYSGRKKK